MLFFYAALFGALLPFICWGALAMPGHPHAGPHFVFLSPPHYTKAAGIATASASTAHFMAMVDKDSPVVHPPAPACDIVNSSASTPAGQAYPMFLAVSLILLIGLAIALSSADPNHHGFSRCLPAFARSSLIYKYPLHHRVMPFPA
ncbi:MAG: hypothetical protein R2867_09460 [Caldilineaceae bacterium]